MSTSNHGRRVGGGRSLERVARIKIMNACCTLSNYQIGICCTQTRSNQTANLLPLNLIF
ncbi:unnamed protein product, partial [Ceratitis capitata]